MGMLGKWVVPVRPLRAIYLPLNLKDDHTKKRFQAIQQR